MTPLATLCKIDLEMRPRVTKIIMVVEIPQLNLTALSDIIAFSPDLFNNFPQLVSKL